MIRTSFDTVVNQPFHYSDITMSIYLEGECTQNYTPKILNVSQKLRVHIESTLKAIIIITLSCD